MDFSEETHMNRELRTFAKEHLTLTEINLLRAQADNEFAEEIEERMERDKQEQEAFDRARQFCKENSISSEFSSTELSTEINPFPLEQSIKDLDQTIGAFKFNLSRAKTHHEAAKLAVQGKITPTARVNEFNTKIGETGSKIADLTISLQDRENSLRFHSQYYIAQGQQEIE